MSYNYHEEADDQYCPRCTEPMRWEDDIDVDADTGQPFVCGGDWVCDICVDVTQL